MADRGAGKDGALQSRYVGEQSDIVHCDGAIESFRDALSRLQKGKAATLTRGMILQIERLASGQRLSKEHFRQEGSLPGCDGTASGGKFYALKRLPIRAYCWKSSVRKSTWYISHYTVKDHQKLKQKDIDRIAKNWREVECE